MGRKFEYLKLNLEEWLVGAQSVLDSVLRPSITPSDVQRFRVVPSTVLKAKLDGVRERDQFEIGTSPDQPVI